MYLAYGWPQSIPLDPDDSDRVVLLRVLGRLLLAVCPASLHLWSAGQHRVRLARSDRSPESLAAHGHNAHAVWSPDAKTVAVLTSSFYLYVYKVQHSGKQLIVGGKQVPGLCLASISLIITEKVPLANGVAITSNFVCDGKSMLLGLSNGHVQVVSWNAEFSDSFKLGCSVCSSEKPTALVDALVFDPPSLREISNARPAPCCTGNSSIVHVELSVKLRLLVALYSGCHIALCTIGKKGLRQPGSIRVERWLDTDDAMCTSVASEQQILAVGCSRGVVELYDLAENTRHIRTISLYDWGYSVEDTGPVACISWTPDNCAFAVGWKFRGLTVWSVSGCRLMCTIRQTGSSSASSPMVKASALKFEPLMGGTSHIQWDDNGYKLFAVEESLSERVLAFSFAKCCLNRGLSGTTYSHQVLYGEDRILLVQPDDADELKILHLNVPVSYISQNWPVLHVVASNDGMYLAVAGSHGLVLYDLRNKRWRFFGDVTQEQKIQCKGLLWLEKIVIVCNYVESSNTDTTRHVEQLVVFGGFTDTQFLEKSLVKQFNELEDSLKEAFLMPFTTISSQIQCQGLLPLYPVTSSVNLSSSCKPTSISFYKDEESPHEESSYSLTDYVCFKIPDGSLNKTNCIGVMKDSGNCCTALSMASLSGFLLHIPDEYECVDLSLYKDKQIVLLLNETSCADSPGKSWMVMLRTENFSFMPLSGTFPANIYSLQKLVALDLQLDTDYGKVRSIPHTVSTPLAVSASRGVACVFSSRRHALVYILDEDEEEEEEGEEISDKE